MATAPKALEPEITDNVVLLPIADIEVGERLRPVDPVWAEALGGIIVKEGQRTPIEVCQLPGRTNWLLVVGAHRLTGMKAAGQAYVKAIVVTNNAAERRMREISENIWRKDLAPLDRATFVAELVTLHKLQAGVDPTKDGRAISAGVRWQKVVKLEAFDATVTMTDAYGFNDQVAERLGLSLSAIERDLTLYRRLDPQVASLLRGTKAGENAAQLRALAKLEPARQREIATMLTRGDVKSVAEGVATLDQRPKADPETKRLNAVLGNLGRMGKGELQAALDRIAGQYTQAVRRALEKAQAFNEAGK